jgi:hypothetical protein
MKRNVLIMFIAGLACLAAWSEPTVLDTFDGHQLPASAAMLERQSGVKIALDQTTGANGKGSIRISCDGDEIAEAMFFAKALSGTKQRMLWFSAHWKGEALTKKAYLEMLVTLPDGNTCFSRGLEPSQFLVGNTEWRTCRIPFYLKKGDVATSVKAGVRFEGQGTVWLDKATLTEDMQIPDYYNSKPGTLGLSGALGVFLGAVLGVWAGVAGTWAGKGKRRKTTMISGTILLILCVIFLTRGIFLLVSGASWIDYRTCVLGGATFTVITALLLLSFLRLYRRAEAQRMQALDESESL